MEELPIVISRAVEPFFKNGYLLACPVTKEGFYIDPGDEAPQIISQIEELEVQLKAVVNTHAHMDHICGISQVKERFDVPIYLHAEDRSLYESLPQQGQWFGMQYQPAPPADRELEEGVDLTLGKLSIGVIHTPGHSPGHVCLICDRYVFCGDTVFAGSIGRTDLPGGSLEVLMRSIRRKIIPLGDEKILYPGHGPATTIGKERETNPFLTDSDWLTQFKV